MSGQISVGFDGTEASSEAVRWAADEAAVRAVTADDAIPGEGVSKPRIERRRGTPPRTDDHAATRPTPLPASLRVRHARELAQFLPVRECWSLLRSHRIGRLAVVVDGWPVVLPVNYVVDRDDLVIRTSGGLKLEALRRGSHVAFEIDEFDALYRCGWSVLVLGRGSEITAADALDEAAALPLRPWAGGERESWIRIEPLQVTGRRLPRAWRYPDPVR